MGILGKVEVRKELSQFIDDSLVPLRKFPGLSYWELQFQLRTPIFLVKICQRIMEQTAKTRLMLPMKSPEDPGQG